MNSRRLVRIALAWFAAGLGLALATPWLGLAPDWLTMPLNIVAPMATALLLAWLFVASVQLVGRTGRTLLALPLTLCQVLLFGLLFFQIAAHQGAGHYALDGSPRAWDWAAFTTAHAVRASDLLDVVEAYDLNIQAVRHASTLTAAALVAFHLVTGLFLVSLLTEMMARIWKTRMAKIVVFTPVIFLGGLYLVFTLATLAAGTLTEPPRVVAFLLQEFGAVTPTELLLWPIDDCLRVLDFADVMVIYGVQLHRMPRLWWIGTVSVVVRFAFAFLVAWLLGRFLQRLSLRYFRGFGMSPAELKELAAKHPDSFTRQRAARRLAEVGDTKESMRQHGLVVVAVAVGVLVAGVTVAVVFLADPVGWRAAATRLAQVAVTADDPEFSRAVTALRRQGPGGEAAVVVLVDALPRAARDRRLVLIDLLGDLGPAAAPPLEAAISGQDEETAVVAARALGRVGIPAVPAMVWSLETAPEPARRELRAAILALGRRAVDPLLEVVDRYNAVEVVPLVEALEPYWYRRDLRDEVYQEIRRARITLLLMQDPEKYKELATEAGVVDYDNVLDLGSVSEAAVPQLLKVLPLSRTRAPKQWHAILTLLSRMGPRASEAAPALAEQLQKHPAELFLAGTLDRIEPGWRSSPEGQKVVQTLIARLGDKDARAQSEAALALSRFGPAAAAAVPALNKAHAEGSLPQSELDEALRWINGQREPPSRPPSEEERAARIQELIEKFKNPSFDVRGEAVKEVVRIGRPAVPALLRARQDAHPNLPILAEQALDQIEPRWRKRSLL